jgi:starch-binding outer membrane protein, SusD/RagB family
VQTAEYSTLLRLAEQYLIRSEARAQQNNIAGAQQDINVIRARAGLTATTANDKASLLMAIEQERKVELFTEHGHRWLDLKRTGRAEVILAPIKGSNWQPTDVLYPIPQYQILNDPAMNNAQNPGY